MKAQFGNQHMINVTTGEKLGLDVVAAEGYRVVSHSDCPASERLSSDCRCSGRSMRALRPETQPRLQQSLAALWRSQPRRSVTTVDPGAATVATVSVVDGRLPAPAWAAFVLNHALCG